MQFYRKKIFINLILTLTLTAKVYLSTQPNMCGWVHVSGWVCSKTLYVVTGCIIRIGCKFQYSWVHRLIHWLRNFTYWIWAGEAGGSNIVPCLLGGFHEDTSSYFPCCLSKGNFIRDVPYHPQYGGDGRGHHRSQALLKQDTPGTWGDMPG